MSFKNECVILSDSFGRLRINSGSEESLLAREDSPANQRFFAATRLRMT